MQTKRQRPLTLAFVKKMAELRSLINVNDGDQEQCRYFGAYEILYLRDCYTVINHAGALICRADYQYSRQYGSCKDIEKALYEVKKTTGSQYPDITERQVTRFRSLTTQLDRLLAEIREDYPDAGLSVSDGNSKLFILRDVEQAESPENILDSQKLASLVKSAI